MDLNVITPEDAKQRKAQAIGAGSADAVPQQTDPDGAYSRLLKLVPLPVVGAYVAIQNILTSVTISETTRLWALLVIYAILAAFTVIYFLRRNTRRVSQIITAVVALTIWAAAVTYPSWITGILIILAGAAIAVLRLRPLPEA